MADFKGSKFRHAKRRPIPAAEIEDERFGALMFWLLLLLFIWIVGFFDDIFNYSEKIQILRLISGLGVMIGGRPLVVSPLILLLTILLNAVRILSATVLLFRQKWGLHGILGVYVFAFLFDLFFSYFSFGTVLRLAVVPGFTLFLAGRVWKYLE